MQWLKKLMAPAFTPQGAADTVVAQAKAALGADLISICAYGSWAVGEYMEGHSDLNIVLVARRLDADTLRKLAKVSRGWNHWPLLKVVSFSPFELKRLAEAFPLEFADMAETHKLLHGEDPFGRMEASSSRLAYELEVEARNALVRFRNRWLLGRGGEAEAREVAAATMGWLFPVFRGLIRLKRRKPPRQRIRLIEEVCRQFKFSRRTLLQAHDLRYGRKNAERIDAPGLMERLLGELERVVEIAGRGSQDEPGQAAGSPDREAAPERERSSERSSERGGDRDRGDRDRGDRGERGDRGDRDRGRRPMRGGGDRSKMLVEVRSMMTDAGQKKRWEPKEPERFVSDELSRDANLPASARFGWDRAWLPERRARGYAAPVVAKDDVETEDDEGLMDEEQAQSLEATALAEEAAAMAEAAKAPETAEVPAMGPAEPVPAPSAPEEHPA